MWDDSNIKILFLFRRAINSRTGFGFPKDKPVSELKGWSMKQSDKTPFSKKEMGGFISWGVKIKMIIIPTSSLLIG